MLTYCLSKGVPTVNMRLMSARSAFLIGDRSNTSLARVSSGYSAATEGGDAPSRDGRFIVR